MKVFNVEGATRGVGGNDVLDDVLPKPADCVGDLEIFCGRLEEEKFQKNGKFCYLFPTCNVTIKIAKVVDNLFNTANSKVNQA